MLNPTGGNRKSIVSALSSKAYKQSVVNVVSFGVVPLSSVLLLHTSSYQSTRTGE